MAGTSSWSWRNLLSSSSSGGPAGPGVAGATDGRNDGISWAEAPNHPLDLPNVLGMENFGNTCYVNSVLQVLWFCDPFRESILGYLALRAEAHSADENVASSSKTPMTDAKQAQQQEVVTLFAALQTLFQRMATARDLKAAAAAAKTPETVASPPSHAPTSFGATLSRKVSSRPGTGGRGGAGNVLPSPTTATAAAGSASTLLGGASANSKSSCSNVLVPDTDIKAFLLALKKSNILFDSTAHQDAHELLNHILNAIGDDIIAESRKRPHKEGQHRLLDVSPDGKTFMHRIFEGVLTNETKCMTCESVTSRDECFLDLSLDIERNFSVSGCLQQFSASEMLCSRNKFFCDTCSALQEAEKRMKIKKQPVVLALHLKRFKYEESMGRFVKLAHRVVFPTELRLSNISDDADEPDKLYKLHGIIVHIGQGPHHGHYIGIVQLIRWMLFDDESIRVIDLEDIARYYGEAGGPGSAYVLFYVAADIDHEELGIPDKAAMRKEMARKRKYEAAKAARLQAQAALKRTPSRDNVNGLAMDSSAPSRTSTPAEGKSSLFGRRAFNLSSSSSTNMLSTGGNNDCMSPQAEGGKSSSWLSSLKPRKASISVVQPNAKAGPRNDTDHNPTSPVKHNIDLSLPSNATANPTSHLYRQRSPTRSQHSGRSSSPQAMQDFSISVGDAQSAGLTPSDSVKPSAGHRVLSGLGIGSPPRRTSTLPLTPEVPSSLTAGGHAVQMEKSESVADDRPRSGSIAAAFMRGRSATADRPSTADPSLGLAQGDDSPVINGRLRMRSPSAAADVSLSNAATSSPNPHNNSGSLSRRKTTLSRAFGGLRRGNKDKDKDKN